MGSSLRTRSWTPRASPGCRCRTATAFSSTTARTRGRCGAWPTASEAPVASMRRPGDPRPFPFPTARVSARNARAGETGSAESCGAPRSGHKIALRRNPPMSKSAAEWNAPPKFPVTHYVDSRIYTDPAIFAEEVDKLFRPTWIIACHESEIPNAYDYRLFTHPAGVPLIVVRGEDMKVRAFYNICPHRGNTILYDPAGNAKRMTCIFHA